MRMSLVMEMCNILLRFFSLKVKDLRSKRKEIR